MRRTSSTSKRENRVKESNGAVISNENGGRDTQKRIAFEHG